MSLYDSVPTKIFGGPADALGRATASPSTQRVAETLTATTSRKMKGPQRAGHFSYHAQVAAGSTPVGTLTIWYSNLPNPDETSDADWVQDTGIASLDLSVVANTFVNVGNVFCEYIRFKLTRTSGTISLILHAKVEGISV